MKKNFCSQKDVLQKAITIPTEDCTAVFDWDMASSTPVQLPAPSGQRCGRCVLLFGFFALPRLLLLKEKLELFFS